MGKKSDRQFSTHLEGSTSLEPEEVFELARAATEVAKGRGVKLRPGGVSQDGTELHIDMRSTGWGYASKGIQAAGSQGGVCVAAIPVESHTELLVHLDGVYTSRTSVTVIPVTPKKIVGFEAFETFIHTLEAFVLRADPEADVCITDRLPE